MRTIDINSDLGESFGNWRMGNDEAVIPEITSANVACGFHASDPVTMIRTVALCKQSGVEVGSHPGLPDLLGFGRRPIRITPDDCYAYVLYQTGALQAVLAAAGMTLHHLKPHGAFYSILREDEPLAAAFCEAALALMPEPVVYWPEGPELALPRAARERGIRVVMEVYVDMDYAPDGSIVIQREKHETDIGKAAAQIRRFLEEGVVLANDGNLIPLEAESICVHGDGPNALEVIKALRRTIEDCGNSVAPLAGAASAR
jgi:5-oxoprolinase (ATP-hydrolysing) subunit A